MRPRKGQPARRALGPSSPSSRGTSVAETIPAAARTCQNSAGAAVVSPPHRRRRQRVLAVGTGASVLLLAATGTGRVQDRVGDRGPRVHSLELVSQSRCQSIPVRQTRLRSSARAPARRAIASRTTSQGDQMRCNVRLTATRTQPASAIATRVAVCRVVAGRCGPGCRQACRHARRPGVDPGLGVWRSS